MTDPTSQRAAAASPQRPLPGTSMKLCPCDARILASNDVDGYRYYSCGTCQGIWIPGSALRKTMRPEAVRDLLERLAEGTVPARQCPNEDSHLVALRVRDCEIDICPRCHSVWLDRNEALAIAHCFKESSAIVDADRGSQGAKPAWAGAMIVEAVFNALMLIFR